MWHYFTINILNMCKLKFEDITQQGFNIHNISIVEDFFDDKYSLSVRSAIAILRDDRNGPVDGQYDFAFETADGLSRNEAGSPSGPNGAVVQQGSWS